MKNTIKLSILSFLILSFAACNSTAPKLVSTPTPHKDTGNTPDDQVLSMRQSGGLMGASSEWVLYADGRIESDTGTYEQVPLEQIAQLIDEIEALGFFELESRYVPFNTCCDRMTYELTVRSDEREHSITVLEATPDVPEEVWAVIDRVSLFFTAHQKLLLMAVNAISLDQQISQIF